MTKNQKKKNRQSFITQLLRFLIIFLLLFFIILLGYIFYIHFWLKFQETRIVNHNIRIHNQMERKASEVLNDINRKIVFNTNSLQDVKENLDIARQENDKLTKIIEEYEFKTTQLKPGNKPASQELKNEIARSFDTKANVLANFQEVNNYLICLGGQTLKLRELQELTSFYANNPDKINTEGSLAGVNKELAELSQNASQDIAKIPNCFTENLKPFLDPKLEILIKESQEILLQEIKITTTRQETPDLNLQIPLFLEENREVLESPLKLLEKSKLELEEANQMVEKQILRWKEGF